ncbi:hypothetical protein CY34DRAFT_36581, partial [Suillus luteus UH-Slu-Lm8-n1]
IESEITHLENKRFKNKQQQGQAQWAAKGETISKYRSKINSSKKPCDIIHRLKIPNQNHLALQSDHMAEIARDYHENLQKDTLSEQEEDTRSIEIKNTLSEIPQTQKLQNENSPLHNPLKENHILEVLYASKTGSAA